MTTEGWLYLAAIPAVPWLTLKILNKYRQTPDPASEIVIVFGIVFGLMTIPHEPAVGKILTMLTLGLMALGVYCSCKYRQKPAFVEFCRITTIIITFSLVLMHSYLVEILTILTTRQTPAGLSDTEWVRTDFSGATLIKADLSGADLHGAIFKGSNLREANLSHADLSGADLRGANMSDTILDGAILDGAILK